MVLFRPHILTLMFLLMSSVIVSAQSGSQGRSDLNAEDAEAVAQLIKSQYGMGKAVYLTRIAEQLSLSFASQDQMHTHWQQALQEAVPSPHNMSQINTHALMAQILIRYSNGMTLNRWRQVDLGTFKSLPPLNERLSNSQKFYVWLNLNHYWQTILKRLASQGSTAWLGITELPKAKHKILNAESQLHKTLDFVVPLNAKIPPSDQDHTLVDKITDFSHRWSSWTPLSAVFLRMSLHQNRKIWLAWAYDWIEVYQRIELSPHLLTAEEQQALQKAIFASQSLWSSQQAIIEARDKNLFLLLQRIFEQLPAKFKNPDHFDAQLNNQILALAIGLNDPDNYFTQPLRTHIQKNLEVCLNLSTHIPPNPEQPIADHQFESCLQDFIDWAQIHAFDTGMAGQLTVLDSPVSMARVLDMADPQIINYLPAQAVEDQRCLDQFSLKPNPLEWLLAVESLNWLHDRWPGLMAEKPPTQADIESILKTGSDLYQYPDCFQPAGVLRSQFTRLEQKWTTLKQAIRLYIKEYRDTHMATGSDIDFFQNTDQLTDAVPDNLVISACDVNTACGANIKLKPDNKILQLFPNHLKIAQQLKLGDLSICYDNVNWQERQSLPTQLNNKKIANYEGQLQITLVGKFKDHIVFEQALETSQRYIYLFAENNPTVLDMDCPLPVIGQQITTSLDRGTFGLLPNRLTFLAAQKVDVNNIIKHHWPQWQNSINVSQVHIVDPMDSVKPLVNETFILHANTVQQQIYRKLTTSNPARIYDSALSNAVFEYLTENRRLKATVETLFPSTYHKNAPIRSALTGDQAILNLAFFKHAYETQLNLMDMMTRGDALIEQHKPAWFNQQRRADDDFLQPSLVQFEKRFTRPEIVRPETPKASTEVVPTSAANDN